MRLPRGCSSHFPRSLVAHLVRLGLALHIAALDGDAEQVAALISRGDDPDVTGSDGSTPLMLAANEGHADVAAVLLSRGAKVSKATKDGCTALHIAAKHGNAAVVEMLVKAGASPDEATSLQGSTALHMAAEEEHLEVIAVLVEAGANLNCRTSEGETPLYTSCEIGRPFAVRALLRAKPDPLLTCTDEQGQIFLPLEIAAFRGHCGVVRELLEQLGAEGCGGASRGVKALSNAAQEGNVGVMAILTEAGVVDTGVALVAAAGYCGEAPVKFLLQQQRRRQLLPTYTAGGGAYVDAHDTTGKTPLICGVLLCSPSSPRVVRMLVDAGANTASDVRLVMPGGVEFFRGSPLAFVEHYVGQKKEADAPQETLNTLEAIRRLLLRMEAARAASWLWHSSSEIPALSHAAEGGARTETVSAAPAATPLMRMLPILRRRANRRGVVLAPLFRRSSKP